jgi:hypothetical protein
MSKDHESTHTNDLIDQMYTLISECEEEEQAANTEFGKIMSNYSHALDIQLNNIDEIQYQINITEQRAKALSSSITSVYQLAEDVSSKIRQLHLVQSRVKEALDAIEGNIGMKSCLQGVEEAIKEEDYEAAVKYVSRVYHLNEQQKKRTLAGKEKDISNESEAESKANLEEAGERIRVIVRSKFKESINQGNINEIQRFAKLFAPLKIEREGLIMYTEYLINITKNELEELINENIDRVADLNVFNEKDSDSEDGLDNHKEEETITFVILLYKVIDVIVATYEQEESFITDNFGGKDKALYTLLELQQLCDKMSQPILDKFIERRKINEKLVAVKQKMRSGYQQDTYNTTRRDNRAVGTQEMQITEGPDPREMDLLLEEMVALCKFSQVYERFVQSRAKAALSDIESPEFAFPRISNMSTRIQEIMSNYIIFDEYFMREGIGKAIQLNKSELQSLHQSSLDYYRQNVELENDVDSDSSSDDDAQKHSNLIDDTFFIMQKSLVRCVSSTNVSVICAVVNCMNAILTGIFQDELDKYIVWNREKKNDYEYNVKNGEFQLKILLIGLNNFEVAGNYVVKLKQEFEKMCNQLLTCEDKNDKKKIDSCASDLITTSIKFQATLGKSIKQLVQTRIEQAINQALEPLDNYMAIDQGYNNNIESSQFIETFTLCFNNLLSIYQKNLTSTNFDKLLQEILLRLTTKIENKIEQMQFNQFSAWQFDKDLRSLMLYFSEKTQMAVRDKFGKLIQKAFLLKLGAPEEILEYWGENAGASMSWRLSKDEVRAILSLRKDFDKSLIQNLSL